MNERITWVDEPVWSMKVSNVAGISLARATILRPVAPSFTRLPSLPKPITFSRTHSLKPSEQPKSA